ncbi:hypothetical protein [Bacillus licheniformis]|uniref:hypothetical protein n=1 Tax=Bacillus licheniformis TaxID=1402 RepID=UPI0008FBBB1D|nr:hypothetical protein [Bacillus licheniformis]OIS80662.1 hypothetical protein A4A43_09655 [Bacillus licheniformis]OIS81741.1 hypothetical protein A4A40_07600 [Bacillus licheniformis]OIS82245.1 hypothetical protein A4A38_05620 [Bacillus licheniformis]OIS89962.1 hypothetical protein A4A42_00065 [Bacillus licheniformis]TWK91162.1 hypothetical protein CHCC20327_2539 [Bacillus licheniformis]
MDNDIGSKFNKLTELINPHLTGLSEVERCEIEGLFSDVAGAFIKMKNDISIYEKTVSFMKDWNLTPEEMIKILKMTKETGRMHQ